MCNYNLRKVDKLDLKDSPNSNSTRNQVDEEPLSGCTTSKSLFIYLFIYLSNELDDTMASGPGDSSGQLQFLENTKIQKYPYLHMSRET